MRSLYLLLVGITLFNLSASAQTITSSGGGSGLWSDPASWSPATVPTVANSTSVTIGAGHTITVGDTRSIDQLTVNGTLVVNSGFTLTINDNTGAASDIIVNGTLTNHGTFLLFIDPPPPPILNAVATINGTFNNSGTITNASTTRLIFTAGSSYNHQHTSTAGVIPTASWNATSTCSITGYTTNTDPPLGLNQNFGHFTWDTPLLENYINLNGVLTSVAGNLTISNVPGSYLTLSEATGYTLNIGGNFTVSNSYVFLNTGAVASINVTGTTLFQNNLDLSMVFDGSTTLDLNGNVTFDGGTNNLTYDGSGSLIFTVAGNFSLMNSPVINNAGSGTYTLTFDGASPQTYTASQEFSGFSYIIQNGSQVNVPTGSSFSGVGAFTIQGGATLGVGSANGLVIGTAQGTVRVQGTRTYAAGANIIYNGSTAQNLGSEWGSSGALNGVSVNLEIANTGGTGVTNNIIGGTSLVGRLRLTQGSLNIGNSNSLVISGDVEGFSSPTRVGTISGDATGTSDLQFTGSGTITGTLNFTSGANTLRNFSITRNTDIPLGNDLIIATTGVLSFTGTGSLVIDDRTLTVNGNITQSSTGGIKSNVNTTNISIGGSGALTALPLTTGSLFNNITLSRNTGTYSWNASATVSGTLDLATGTLTHSSGLTMGPNSTFKRSAGTTYSGSTPNATSRYSVSYTGTLTTSNELPTTALDRLLNLTIAGDVTLDKNILINGDLNIDAGKLSAGPRSVTMLGANFLINGGTFDIASSASVTFGRAGSTIISGSTVNDAQFGNFVINSGTTVVAPAANINVSNAWTNGGTFTPGTGTVTFNGTTQNINANGQPFFNVATSGGTKTLTGALDVNGTLVINSGSTLVASTFPINIAGIWDNNGTFTPGSAAVIFDGAAQTVDNSGQSFNAITFAGTGTKTLAAALDANGALTINNGVTLDVSASNYAINVAGNWANNGTFNARTGTVIFDSGVIQTVGGSAVTAFYNITNLNASTLTISTDQTLTNALSLQAGTFNPNGHFTLLSSVNGDARIDQLQGTATIANSSLTVQRFLPNGDDVRAQRYITPAVSNATLQGWKDDFPITGPMADHSTNLEWAGQGLPTFTETSYSVYTYNESHTPTTTINDRYEGFPASGTIASAALMPGVGYGVQMRAATDLNIELVGRPNFGPVSVTVTAQGATANDGWNLVGNPYPSPINWNNVTRPAGLSAQIAMKDNTNTIGLGAGQYVYYTAGGAGIPASYTGTIAQGQAFWVRKTTAGPATLTFQEDDKQATSTPPFMKQGLENMLRVNVAGISSLGKPVQDELIIAFDENAQDIAEGDHDAFKLANSFVNFSSLSSDNKELAINTFGSLSCSREIPLVLKNVVTGGHLLTFSQVESFSSGVDIRLLDSYTGQTFVVGGANTTYSFSVDAGDANSFGANRFKIYIGYKQLDLSLAVQGQDGCKGSDAQVQILATQPGITYYATINGTTVSDKVVATDVDVQLTIPSANLTDGENTVILKAQSGTCAEMPLAQSVTVKKNGVPVVSGILEGTSCGEGSVTLSATGAPSGGNYRWYLTEDATDAIAGQTASSFTTPSLSKTKTYFVSAVGVGGCEGERVPVTATVSYVDPATITVNNDELVSNSDHGNQWYLDGVLIEGATGKSYKPTQGGIYKLIVTTGTCSSEVEEEFAVTGDIDETGLKGYALYPNPSSGIFYVEVATASEVSVSVVNGVGIEVTRAELKQEGNSKKAQIDISGRAAGIYLVVIKHDQKTVTRKIVKN